ncbi:MAG TPA: alanyl-tRNA editing protein [Candidatus Aenigmarchaeota archaeon]|nr:MAG: alanyl-tRNA editing protein AlaX [Candidatus Aenigmarchaeota archaeon]HDD46356.1 alanyl-tRNA editing protein [Candidatus Aenigmarchaeota archaeon]
MEELIYMQDCYVKEFDAIVEKVENNKVFLNRTAFYPTGGGFPHDVGKIIRAGDGKIFNVIDVVKDKEVGRVAHIIASNGLKEGDKVRGAIDWERRYRLMKMHTTAHALSAVIAKHTSALITGGQLGLDKSRIDFNLEEFDKEKIKEYIDEVNEELSKGRKVKIYFMKREEAEKIPNITKLAKGLPPSIKNLRIVEIEGLDLQADGGPHVANTKEIGKVIFLKAENKGKNNRRIYFTLQ